MSQQATFTATVGNTSFGTRLTKAVQHIDIVRFGTLSVLMAGLLAGLPETISAEITHPIRDRVRPADRVSLGHIALHGQFRRGPIVEIAPVGVVADVNGVLPASADNSQLYKLTVKYYVNDFGALEILADDHFNVTVDGCVPGCSYELNVPEVPVNPLFATRFNKFEPNVILGTDRERKLQVSGKSCIILPRTANIERLLITTEAMGDMPSTTIEASMDELLSAQADKNPFVAIRSAAGPLGQRSSLLQSAQDADFFLLDFKAVAAVQIDTVLGQEVRYTLVTYANR